VNARAAGILGSLKSRLETKLFTLVYSTQDCPEPSQRHFWFTVTVWHCWKLYFTMTAATQNIHIKANTKHNTSTQWK